jgi:hypothetical protein
MEKIAFCFLINDIINHEELWYTFFKNVPNSKYNIYIHYKIDVPLTYFEKYKIKNCIETKYENYTIPLAYNVLFREAYNQCEENVKFCIVSGSCIPLKSFDYIYKILTKDDKGYFNECPSIQCFPNCNPLLPFINKENIYKSHNWFILNRKLVENLCIDKDDILINHYKNIYAPAEYFYLTYIKLLKMENEINITNNIACASTFTNWEGMNYPYPSVRGLQYYCGISEEELVYLLNSKSLFGRKFHVSCLPYLYNKIYLDSIISTNT